MDLSFGFDSTPPTAVPTAIAPRDGAETTATAITFRLIGSTDTGVGGSAVRYLFQVSRQETFGTVLSTQIFTETTFVASWFFGESNTVYWWRVAAVDSAGNQTGWSGPDSFRRPGSTDAGRPIGVAAFRAMATDNLDIELSWYSSPSADVSQYNIYWNQGITSAPADTLLGTIPHDGRESYSWSVASRASLVANTFYLFRIHAQDTGGNQDTAGAVAGAMARSTSPGQPYTSLITPQSGQRIRLAGGVQVQARIEGTRSLVETLVFQFRRSGGGAWTNMTTADSANFPNPMRIGAESRTVYGIRWNAAADGAASDSLLEIRVTAQRASGESQPGLSEVIAVWTTTSDTDADVVSDSRSVRMRGVNGQPVRIALTFLAGIHGSIDLDPRSFSVAEPTRLIFATLGMDSSRTRFASGAGAQSVRGHAANAATLNSLAAGDTVVGHVLDIDLSDSSGAAVTQLAAGKTASITMSLPSGYAPESLVVRSAHSGGETQQWSYDSAGNTPSLSFFSYDSVNRTVTFLTSKFSSFILVVPAIGSGGPGNQASLAQFMVYPNPWRPNDGNAATGRAYDPASPRTTGVVFDFLPARVRIELFTLRGEKVFERTTQVNDGFVTWNGRNEAGLEVASGYYIYVVTDMATGQRVTGKLAVIR